MRAESELSRAYFKARLSVFEATSYRQFVRDSLIGKEGNERRGLARGLSLSLHCHPTFISQVMQEKAHFSPDQAYGFCQYMKLSRFESDFFIDLVSRDRAATPALKKYFQERLNRHLERTTDFKERWNTSHRLTSQDEFTYYESWLPQAVHMLCCLPRFQQITTLATALGIPLETLFKILGKLEKFGLIQKKRGKYVRSKDWVHLGKDSPLTPLLHKNWRNKTIESLGKESSGIHYTSLISLSKKSAEDLKRKIVEHLEAYRAEILKSEDEEVYVHLVDFYPIV